MKFVASFRLPQLPRTCLSAGAFFCLVFDPYGAIALGAGRANESGVIAGQARVVDGDTLDVGPIRVRLEGIDAPEADQTCQDASGESWNCGLKASAQLRALAEAGDVMCDRTGTDVYGRALAECYEAGININAAMVQAGLAWAFVRYSMEFSGLEAEARAAKIGVWQGPAEAPWDYRRREWQMAERAAPAGCAIKGNISPRGAYYHVPWSPGYERVKIDEARGERWFCTEGEALAAGGVASGNSQLTQQCRARSWRRSQVARVRSLTACGGARDKPRRERHQLRAFP